MRNFVTFVACGALLLLFVLWTEYSYKRGFDAAYEVECDVGSVN